MNNTVFLRDCMPFLKECKDKEFDLAIVDPPYWGGGTRTGKLIDLEVQYQDVQKI